MKFDTANRGRCPRTASIEFLEKPEYSSKTADSNLCIWHPFFQFCAKYKNNAYVIKYNAKPFHLSTMVHHFLVDV